MTVYLAIHEMKDWPTSVVPCSTEEKAKRIIAADIGMYILDCLRDNDKAAAIDFISKASVEIDEEGNVEFYTFGTDDYVIEKKEVDEGWLE